MSGIIRRSFGLGGLLLTKRAPGAKGVAFTDVSKNSCRHFSSKLRKQHVCSNCNYTTVKWHGQCPQCQEYNCFEEEVIIPESNSSNQSPSKFMSYSAGWFSPSSSHAETGDNVLISSIDSDYIDRNILQSATSKFTPLEFLKDSPLRSRISSGSEEIDRLLGGGLTCGSVSLLCGPPGVGKSTFVIQLAALLTNYSLKGHQYSDYFSGIPHEITINDEFPNQNSEDNINSSKVDPRKLGLQNDPINGVVAYVSGEEAASQIGLRANRLGLADSKNIVLLNETNVDIILEKMRLLASTLSEIESSYSEETTEGAERAKVPPIRALMIDSIQTMFTTSSTSPAGSISQIRESTLKLLQFAKASSVPVILIGHVNKNGDIAGPRLLEHMVDTVIFMESGELLQSVPDASVAINSHNLSSSAGSGSQSIRVIRCLKNRFGCTNEVASLEMTDDGFRLPNSDAVFLSSTNTQPHLNDSRLLLCAPTGVCVGVSTEGSRALCVEAQALCMRTYGTLPRVKVSGLAAERVHLLQAVLTKHGHAAMRASFPLRKVLRLDSFHAVTASGANSSWELQSLDALEAAEEAHSLGRGQGRGHGQEAAPNSLMRTMIRPQRSVNFDAKSLANALLLSNMDVYITTAAGVRITDSSMDLALAMSLVSSTMEFPLLKYALYCGEVQLTGDIRAPSNLRAKMKTARKLRFRIMYIPEAALRSLVSVDPRASWTAIMHDDDALESSFSTHQNDTSKNMDRGDDESVLHRLQALLPDSVIFEGLVLVPVKNISHCIERTFTDQLNLHEADSVMLERLARQRRQKNKAILDVSNSIIQSHKYLTEAVVTPTGVPMDSGTAEDSPAEEGDVMNVDEVLNRAKAAQLALINEIEENRRLLTEGRRLEREVSQRRSEAALNGDFLPEDVISFKSADSYDISEEDSRNTRVSEIERPLFHNFNSSLQEDVMDHSDPTFEDEDLRSRRKSSKKVKKRDGKVMEVKNEFSEFLQKMKSNNSK